VMSLREASALKTCATSRRANIAADVIFPRLVPNISATRVGSKTKVPISA